MHSFNLTDQVSCSQTVRGRQWGFTANSRSSVFRLTVKLLHANKIGHIVGPNNCVSVMQELSIVCDTGIYAIICVLYGISLPIN